MRRKKAKRICPSSTNELLLYCKLAAQNYSAAEMARTGGGVKLVAMVVVVTLDSINKLCLSVIYFLDKFFSSFISIVLKTFMLYSH